MKYINEISGQNVHFSNMVGGAYTDYRPRDEPRGGGVGVHGAVRDDCWLHRGLLVWYWQERQTFLSFTQKTSSMSQRASAL